MKLFLTALILFSNNAFAQEEACKFEAPPQKVLFDTRKSQGKIWVIHNSETLFKEISVQDEALDRYRNWVVAQTNTDPYFLLERQREIYARVFGLQKFPDYDLIIENKIGKIRNMNCLESLLLAEHTRKFPLEKYSNEFTATILERDGFLKIYFISDIVDKHGGGPSMKPIQKAIYSDLSQGWKAKIDLHNHPFFFKNPTGDIAGTTIPSGNAKSGDVLVFMESIRKMGLESATITNGFSTIELDAANITELFRVMSGF
jgi:hypothetical protein